MGGQTVLILGCLCFLMLHNLQAMQVPRSRLPLPLPLVSREPSDPVRSALAPSLLLLAALRFPLPPLAALRCSCCCCSCFRTARCSATSF